jgi:hypothetical protein
MSIEYPSVPVFVAAVKAEILELIADGTIPATVTTFSELHDYIDANMLGEDLFPPMPEAEDDDDDDYWEAMHELVSDAQDDVHQWLQAGRPS